MDASEHSSSAVAVSPSSCNTEERDLPKMDCNELWCEESSSMSSLGDPAEEYDMEKETLLTTLTFVHGSDHPICQSFVAPPLRWWRPDEESLVGCIKLMFGWNPDVFDEYSALSPLPPDEGFPILEIRCHPRLMLHIVCECVFAEPRGREMVDVFPGETMEQDLSSGIAVRCFDFFGKKPYAQVRSMVVRLHGYASENCMMNIADVPFLLSQSQIGAKTRPHSSEIHSFEKTTARILPPTPEEVSSTLEKTTTRSVPDF